MKMDMNKMMRQVQEMQEQMARAQEELANEKVRVEAVSHPDSIYAGAIGAALWGEFRHQKLKRLEERRAA